MLAEVAHGGADESQRRRRRGEERLPRLGGAAGARARALMRRLGDLITKHVPDLSETETRDTGQAIAQTAQAAGAARGRQLPLLRRDVHARRRPHLSDPTHLNYTLYHPVGVCALISPWNVPFMTATWKVAPASRSATPRC